MHDEKIISLIANKDQLGIEQLEIKYKSFAIKTALRLINSKEDAEECVNDALLNVWNSKHITETKDLKTLIAFCVRRRVIDLIRHEKAKKRSQNAEIILTELDYVCAPQTVESSYDNNELNLCIEKFVKALPRPDKDIFLMRYFYGMEITEIAKKQFMSRNAVDGRLFRCRKKLKIVLEEME